MNKTLHYTFLIIITIISHTAKSQTLGTVFWDTNENGKKDKNEKYVEGAIVSNGLHVVQTDSKGIFLLPAWEKARFVTIYPKADQAVNKRYIEIGQKDYTFAVRKKEQKNEVTFVQISDTETYEYKDWLNNLKDYSKASAPDFIIHTGDICYEAGMEWHAKEITTQTMGVPVYYCLGNHDLVKGPYGEAFFENKFGPAWYAFEEGNALYVVTPMMGGDYTPGFTREEIGEWLQNMLNVYPKEIPKYFFNHDLLTNGDNFDFKIDNKKHIRLNEYNLKAWLFGHWHINTTKTHSPSQIKSYSTATASQGGIDHSPSSFRVVTVDKDGNSTSRLKWTYVDNSIQIISPHNNNVVKDVSNHINLSANVYASNADIDSVTYKIYDEKGLNWSSARDGNSKHMVRNTDWNWSVQYSPDKNSNNFTIAVKAYLNNGDVLYRKEKFRISNSPNHGQGETSWFNLGGNPEHDAVSSFQHSPSYELSWVKNLKGNIYMSSPVLYKNYVYAASFDDNNAVNNYIVCYNAFIGEEVWRYKTTNGIKNQMVIAQGIIIATDVQGFTYALYAETGKIAWKADLNYNKLPAFISGIVTNGNTVFTGFGSSLSALDVKTGNLLWTNKDWDGGEGSTPTMTLANDILITSSNWRAVYAHDIKTGKLLWKRDDNGLRFRNGNVLFKQDTLWIAENNGNKGTLHLLDPETGKSFRNMDTDMSNKGTSTPIVTDSNIYIAGSDPGIASFSRSTGKKLWEFEVLPAMLYTPQYYSDQQKSIETTPVLTGNSLIFGAMDGWVYHLDANNGSVLWKTDLAAPVLTSAAVSEDGFYICDFAGNIYFFRNKKQ